MRLRGLFGARDEFLLAAIVQNLKTRRFDPLVHPSRSRARLLPETISERCSGRLFAMSDEDFMHHVEYAHPKLFWHWCEPRRCV